VPVPSTTEHRYPCDKCGSSLRFAPGQTDLVCPNCGNVQQIPKATARDMSRALGELSLQSGLKNDLPQAAMQDIRTSTCPNCGALVEFDGAIHAMDCPFCASPVVADTGTHRQIKPQALVPFVLTERQAHDALTDWLGSLWFAPNSLLEYTRKGRTMTGIYVPFWTFDADTRTRYRGQRGDYYYETRTVTVRVNGRSEQREEQVRHTRWSSASGNVSRPFDDVIIMASASLPQRLGDELTPWDLGALEPYSPDYIAGFRSEGYTISLADGNAMAIGKMDAVIRGDIARDIGGDEQRIDSVDTDYGTETFKHILLPVWMAAYKYNGRSFRFLVNGQTAEVQGERPYSIWKIAFAVLAVAIVVAGAVYLNDPEALGLPRPDWLP
jgi:predicted RNA-binding Zn-ribbon protein involved in translation (DUF1610 family)